MEAWSRGILSLYSPPWFTALQGGELAAGLSDEPVVHHDLQIAAMAEHKKQEVRLVLDRATSGLS
jgi:hypothetical protein